jgi:hypothetical protein
LKTTCSATHHDASSTYTCRPGTTDKGCRCSLSGALRQGMEERDRPMVIDVVVTRDPAQMLPAVDNRTVEIKEVIA